MFKRIIFTLIIITITAYESASAQTPKIYTLNDAILEAFKNNSELTNAKYDRLKAKSKVTQTKNENLIPTITLNSRIYRTFEKPVFDIFGQKFEVGTDNSVINQLDITEPIPILGTPVFSGIRIAEYYERLTEENFKAVESKIKTDVKKSFLTVLLLKEVVEVNRKALQNSIDNLTVVETRYRLGTVTEFDYLRAKVKVETIRPSISQAENNLELSRKNLKNVMGLKSDDEVDVTGKLEYDSLEAYYNNDELIRTISEGNVTIRQLMISKKINEEIVVIDKANYLPKLYLFGQYQISSNENDGKFITDFSFFDNLSAGIGLTWTFNFFSNPYKKEQSELEVKKTDETIIDIKNKLRIQAQSILMKMSEARQRIKSNYETVKLAERGYELAVLSFRNGVLNQIDVLDAELMLTQSRLAHLNSIYDYLTARAELEGLLEK